MARDLRFVDPAFTCEVALTGTALALYEASKPQFERLRGIRSLGLMALIRDVAVHTRHQHLVGMMRIFNKLCQQPREKGLPKTFLWSFWCRLCFAQTGHAALSYDSEKAVLLACHMDTGFKAALRTLLQPVIDNLAACTACTKACDLKAKGAAEADVWFDDLVTRNRWRHLHLWIAALKLVQEPKLPDILNNQVRGPRNELGFSHPEAIKLLVAPNCQWDHPMRNLGRLDFIVRDLALAGTLAIHLDVDNLVSTANEPHPDWDLLQHLGAYMSQTLYESLEAQTASVLFQRALADLLIDGRVNLEMLFGIDLSKRFSDDDLRNIVARRDAGRDVFEPDRRQSWRAWPISTYTDEQRVPSDVEREITGYKKGHLSHHICWRATCLKLQDDQSIALAISHKDLSDRPKAKVFVKLCRSILKKRYPKLASRDLTCALFEGLIARRCDHGLVTASERLGELPVKIQTLSKAADVVNRHACGRADARAQFSFKIGGYEYPLRGDPQEMVINMMHAALSGDQKVRDDLGITAEGAAAILWDQLLDWQSVYFGVRPTQTITTLLAEAQYHLARRVADAAATARADLELYTLLEALKHPSDAVSFRIALPNLKLIKEDGQLENEYDVVSVILKEDKEVEAWVWGVTTETNLTRKRAEDLAKIQKLNDLLGNRWESDVRVVTNYIHKADGGIGCQIDGRQERRPVQSLLHGSGEHTST